MQFELSQKVIYLPLVIEHLANGASMELGWLMQCYPWLFTPGRVPAQGASEIIQSSRPGPAPM